MPIPAELRKRYYSKASGWLATRERILARAQNCCERCGKPNSATVFTLEGGIWFDELLAVDRELDERLCWRAPGDELVQTWLAPEDRGIRLLGAPIMDLAYEVAYLDGDSCSWMNPKPVVVILTIAHLNHTPGDDRDENLAAWCQWCHLDYDVEHHADTRKERKDRLRPLLTAVSEQVPDSGNEHFDYRAESRAEE